MTEVRKRTGKKDEKSIKTEKSNGPESDSKSKVIQIGKILLFVCYYCALHPKLASPFQLLNLEKLALQ